MRVGLRAAGSAGVLVVAVIAGHQRHAGLFHQLLGGGLRAHRADRRRRRADEDEARRRAGRGEVFVLGQEAVARMDRLRAGGLRGVDDRVAAQIASSRAAAADQHRLVASRAHACALASASEYTATVRMPRRRAVAATRQAISPRLAIRILVNSVPAGSTRGGSPAALRGRRPHAGRPCPCNGKSASKETDHIRNTPNCAGIGALSDAASKASTRRVSAGSITPSSHRRALA